MVAHASPKGKDGGSNPSGHPFRFVKFGILQIIFKKSYSITYVFLTQLCGFDSRLTHECVCIWLVVINNDFCKHNTIFTLTPSPMV